MLICGVPFFLALWCLLNCISFQPMIHTVRLNIWLTCYKMMHTIIRGQQCRLLCKISQVNLWQVWRCDLLQWIQWGILHHTFIQGKHRLQHDDWVIQTPNQRLHKHHLCLYNDKQLSIGLPTWGTRSKMTSWPRSKISTRTVSKV